MKTIPLLDSESNSARYDGIISTISRFRGRAPVNELTRRFKSILKVNPWITSTLKNQGNNEFFCEYEDVINDISPWFELYDINDLLQDDKSIDKLVEMISLGEDRELMDKLYILPTEDCIDTDAQLIKFCLIEDKDKKEFAIIFSMNHIISDGTSYYNLLNSLSFDEDIIPFNFKRKLEFTRLGFDKNHFSLKTMKENKKHKFVKKVNLELIEKIKKDTNEILEDEWVSTNDVVSSLFFNSVKSDVSIYPVNARPYIDYLSDIYVGNYIKPVIFKNKREMKAKDIRHAINKIKNDPENNGSCINKNEDGYISDNSQTIQSESRAALTSWVQSYKQISLGSECSYVAHYPLKPSYLHGESLNAFEHGAILFCLNSAVWILAGVTSDVSWLENNVLFLEG